MPSLLTRLREPLASRGFSLVEVLVALAILSVGLVVLMQSFGTTLRSVSKAEQHTRATVIARSLLDEALASSDPESLETDLSFDAGFTAERQVEVVEFQPEAAAAANEEGGSLLNSNSLSGTGSGGAPEPMEMYEITVTVRWQPSGSIQYKVRRIKIDDDGGPGLE